MIIDDDNGYELDEHKVDEIDVEFAWAFALIAGIVSLGAVLSLVARNSGDLVGWFTHPRPLRGPELEQPSRRSAVLLTVLSI